MPRARRFLVVATLLGFACASCSQSEDPSSGSSTPATASSTLITPTTSATSSIPPYMEKYRPEERQAYAEAVKDYELFAEQQATIMAAGKATPKARRYYQKFTADWLTYWNVLRQRAADGIRVEGRGETLRLRPARIKLGEGGSGSVDVRVCGVSTGVEVFKHGTPIPQPAPTPTIVKVSLVRLPGESWWRVLLQRVGAPC